MESSMQLKYRPSVQRFYRWVIGLTLAAEVIIIRMNIFKLMEESWIQGIFTLILASTVPLSILIRVFFFVRPWVKSAYELLDDQLLIRSGKKEKQLKFQDVARVNYSWFSPRFFGGFNLELSSGQKFRFFSVLEDSHKILERLHQIKPDVLVEKEYQHYMQVSSKVGQSWTRLNRKLKNWQMLFIKYLLAPLIGGWFLWYKGWSLSENNNFVYILSLVTLVFWGLGALFNHFEEAHLLKQPENNLAYDAKIGWIVDSLYLTLCLIIVAGIALPLS